MDIEQVKAAGEALSELARMADEQKRRPEFIRAARAVGIDWDIIAVAGDFSRSTAINLSKAD